MSSLWRITGPELPGTGAWGGRRSPARSGVRPELSARGAGHPSVRATEITGDVVVNRVYRNYLHGAREKLAEGAGFSQTLKGSDLFLPLLIHMIAVGEKGGELEKMLLKAGIAFEKEFDTAVTRSMSLLEPLLILGMGATVGTVVVAVLLPIFELNQLVK
jgi:general secretion pathway protein F